MGTRSGRKGMRRVAVSLYNIPLFYIYLRFLKNQALTTQLTISPRNCRNQLEMCRTEVYSNAGF